ncbi:50S ribosomal protein L25/general stress protein Ctc [Ornithinibacillus scapharcae]|uniref:50S ribosomal protein L25/general stress protein Ctc n=1 Tax=Ornithinibacillus scapharcae TaxID=1147159 RepID=UPI000225B895|nr:50S ribosomal protein L25/general stress protein Ctc [Ornithinibacillus scapharcae]
MTTLVAHERNDSTRADLKRLRSNGEIPAVVYGSDIKTVSISINNSDLLKALRKGGRNGIISLELNGKSKDVLLRDYQNDKITRDILHADFLQVNKNTEIDTRVSVVLKGTSKGEKAGGIVNQVLHELDITAKADDIPDTFEIDITKFEIGDTVSVGDLRKEYSNCTIHHEDEETIVLIDYVKTEVKEEEESEVEASGV